MMSDFNIIISVSYSHEDMQISLITSPEEVDQQEFKKAIELLKTSIKL